MGLGMPPSLTQISQGSNPCTNKPVLLIEKSIWILFSASKTVAYDFVNIGLLARGALLKSPRRQNDRYINKAKKKILWFTDSFSLYSSTFYKLVWVSLPYADWSARQYSHLSISMHSVDSSEHTSKTHRGRSHLIPTYATVLALQCLVPQQVAASKKTITRGSYSPCISRALLLPSQLGAASTSLNVSWRQTWWQGRSFLCCGLFQDGCLQISQLDEDTLVWQAW